MKLPIATRFLSKAGALLVASFTLASIAKVEAQTAVSNLGQSSDGSNFWIGVNATPITEHDTFSFTTGTTAASFDFTGVTLKFASAAGSASGLTFGLYSTFNPSTDVGTGTLLTNLTLTSGDPTVAGTYSLSGSASLLPSTTYYLKISADTTAQGSFYQLSSTTSYAESASLTGWSIQDGLYNWNQGSSNWSLYTGSVPQFSVEASAIPEPSTYAALLGVGVLSFAVWRKRRSIVTG